MFYEVEAKQPNQMSYWQLIFSQSKVNGAPYKDDELPVISRAKNLKPITTCGVSPPYGQLG